MISFILSSNVIKSFWINSGVRSIGKSRIGFENPDFGFAIERKIRKRISSLRYMLLDFLLTVRLRNPKKDLENCPNNSDLARVRIISKKKTAVQGNSFANPFADFPVER